MPELNQQLDFIPSLTEAPVVSPSLTYPLIDNFQTVMPELNQQQDYIPSPTEAPVVSPSLTYPLIDSPQTFLVKLMLSFINERLNELEPRARLNWVLDSIAWQTGLIDDGEYPLLTLLNTLSTSPWESDFERYLAQKCIDNGLNPQDLNLLEVIHQLPFLDLPEGREGLEPIIKAIFEAKPFRIRYPAGADSAYMDDWVRLIAVYNVALERMQSTLNVEICLNKPQLISEFYQALNIMQSLHHNNVSLFVGAEDADFQTACKDVQESLIRYYSEFSEDSRLPNDFSLCLQPYLTQEAALDGNYLLDYINNCFSSLSECKELDDLDGWWETLYALRQPGSGHPLVLSHHSIERWHHNSLVESLDRGPEIIELSLYQSNRILLHAFMVSPRDWSPHYVLCLRFVTTMLLRPQCPGEDMLNTLKSSYPPFLMCNLWLVSFFMCSFDIKEEIRQGIDLFWGNEDGFIKHNFLFDMIPIGSLEQIAGILFNLQYYLPDFIQTASELYILFELPDAALSISQRWQILHAVEGRLDELFIDIKDLYRVLELPTSKLNQAQRSKIFTAMQERLIDLIREPDDLFELLTLDESLLDEDQRRLILRAVESHLDDLTPDQDYFHRLLALPVSKLSPEWREKLVCSALLRWAVILSESRVARSASSFFSVHRTIVSDVRNVDDDPRPVPE